MTDQRCAFQEGRSAGLGSLAVSLRTHLSWQPASLGSPRSLTEPGVLQGSAICPTRDSSSGRSLLHSSLGTGFVTHLHSKDSCCPLLFLLLFLHSFPAKPHSSIFFPENTRNLTPGHPIPKAICVGHVCIRLPRRLSGKESAYQCRRPGFNSWVWKILWGGKWQLTPAFLPGKSHGQRSLVGYMGSQRVRHNWATKEQKNRNSENKQELQVYIDLITHSRRQLHKIYLEMNIILFTKTTVKILPKLYKLYKKNGWPYFPFS